MAVERLHIIINTYRVGSGREARAGGTMTDCRDQRIDSYERERERGRLHCSCFIKSIKKL